MFEFFMCDRRLRLRDFWLSCALAVVYCMINFEFTEHLPQPVYPFLLWQRFYRNVAACAICIAIGTTGLFLSGFVQERLMGRKFRDSW